LSAAPASAFGSLSARNLVESVHDENPLRLDRLKASDWQPMPLSQAFPVNEKEENYESRESSRMDSRDS